MELLVIGAGYVGLVTGTCFAEMGHRVYCLDINNEKIDALKKGVLPIYEPGLQELLIRNSQAGRLSFITSYQEAAEKSAICFIAVDTPTGTDGQADLSKLNQVVTQIAMQMEKPTLFINKSTVPVGTGDLITCWVEETLAKRESQIPFDVVSNPEFLKEGDAVADFMKPQRIVLGVENSAIIPTLKEIYAPFMLNRERLMVMDRRSAELTKIGANAMLATRISLMNELANYCEMAGADITSVRRAIGADARIGSNYLYPGIGYGGSCLPKDIQALCFHASSCGCEMPILTAVQQVNQRQKQRLGEKILSYFADRGGLSGKTIAIWGLAFKPDTDDVREASSIALIQQLLNAAPDVQLNLFDPVAMESARRQLPDLPSLNWSASELEAAEGADAIALVTEWRQFRHLNLRQVLKKMAGSAFFDGRNQHCSKQMSEMGFDYFCIGQPHIKEQPRSTCYR